MMVNGNTDMEANLPEGKVTVAMTAPTTIIANYSHAAPEKTPVSTSTAPTQSTAVITIAMPTTDTPNNSTAIVTTALPTMVASKTAARKTTTAPTTNAKTATLKITTTA
jgi:hypothetical protein